MPDRVAIEPGSKLLFCRALSRRTGSHTGSRFGEERSMKAKPGGRTVDLADLPALTEAQTARLEALAALPDETIDDGDIPKASDPD